MLYRPVFCCNCGEKIVRNEWRLWTSRRFCALCATEHQGIDLLPRALVAIALLLSVAAFASYVRRPEIKVENSFKAENAKPNLRSAALYAANSPGSPESNNSDVSNTTSNLTVDPQINEQPQPQKRTSDEPVFYCGAITKKGTPCTRRVKTKGTLCWQHAKSGQLAPARF
jgi:hypothetical protein